MGDGIAQGTVVADRYRLERMIGEGGMGSVWAATHLLTRSSVALKFLKPEALSNVAAVRRFMREARAAAAVNHPNVIRVHDIFQQADGAPVMVMDLLSGETLGEKLAREGRISLPELARLMLPVVSAVGTSHAAGIVHRDLKPDNIFISRTADGRLVPKVLDFGIAKLNPRTPEATQSAELTRTGALLGTPYYMSPEQVFGEKDVDARSDVWAIGVILYEALSGRRPVDGDNLGQLLKIITLGNIEPIGKAAPHLPQDVCELISRMLVTDRATRVQGLHEAFEVLGRHTTDVAQSFSEVRVLPEVDESGRPTSRARLPSEEAVPGRTDVGDGPSGVGSGSITADAFAHTEPGQSPPMHRWPIRAMVTAGIASLVGIGALVSWVGAGPSAAVAPAVLESADSEIVPDAAQADVAPDVAAASVPAVADAAPEATPPTAGSGVVSARSRTAPKRATTVATPTKAAPAKSAEPQPAASAPAKKQQSLGGVATAAPF